MKSLLILGKNTLNLLQQIRDGGTLLGNNCFRYMFVMGVGFNFLMVRGVVVAENQTPGWVLPVVTIA